MPITPDDVDAVVILQRAYHDIANDPKVVLFERWQALKYIDHAISHLYGRHYTIPRTPRRARRPNRHDAVSK